jgi:N-acetyl-gamma-glutamyl-phosphate reductase common form
VAAEPRLNVAVLGASGFVGGELLRLLSRHPDVGVVRGFSESHAGNAWGAVHPVLDHLDGGRFEEPNPRAAAAWADVLFLALPHGRSQGVVRELAAADCLLVDLAADFRIHDRERYERTYGPHEAFELAAGFVYGLADVAAERLAGARRIAVPGCFATAALLALHPFASRGVVGGEAVCFAVTGSSGAGAEPGRSTHHPFRAHNFFAYALGGHRHEVEIEEEVGRWTGGGPPCRLLTHSAPLVRGIHLTARLPLREPCADPLALLCQAYGGRPFMRVLDRPPELAAVVGTNFCHLHAALAPGGREVIVLSVIDNLVKGAAGQAVQAMNLALGLGETAGLEFPGVYPC